MLTLDGIGCVRDGRLLFRDLSVHLAPGEAAVVTGPNGAGKSSLLRIAAGLLRPTAGRVERRGAVALDTELSALDPDRSLGDALAFWARLDGAAGEATANALAALDLLALAPVPVRLLSTGQRRRASLARLVASGARLWLLDEPTTGLDADACHRLAAILASHRAAGGAVLAATHTPLSLAGAREIRL